MKVRFNGNPLQNVQTWSFFLYYEHSAPVSISPLIVPTSLASLSAAASKLDDNIICSQLNTATVPTTTSYISPSNTECGLVAPIPKRARLVLPTISDEDQKRRLQFEQQPQIASLPTQAVQAEPPRASARGLPSAFTPSPSYRTSPATEGRDRRRAYIDFYRKVKSARQREPGPLLNCALCDCQVLSNDNAIHTHVNHHAEAGGFWCKLCGLSECDKYRIYEHMRVNHPNNMELFEDRRDILKLCAVIQECFPRACPRLKKEVVREFDLIIKTIEEKHLTELKCNLCDALVKATKPAITKHAHHHPVYRCKMCKFTSESIQTQEEHQVGTHTSLDPKITVDYNVCSAADVVVRTVQRCFAHVLQSSEPENQEKTATTKS
ncbi:hypothetical protein GCK32_011773 [Trichostrongylus colubriformis]|uniref:C2H2-type domain-containing protein n=1 Tax=Trichostrongylus colubriformis TaxID=6319 RepID=A0AAN8FDN1_TRICO